MSMEFYFHTTLTVKADWPKGVFLNCGTQSPLVDAVALTGTATTGIGQALSKRRGQDYETY